MTHALLNKSDFDRRNNADNAHRKIVHIYEVMPEKETQPILTMAQFLGNKKSVTGADSMGIVRRRLTKQKLTYKQVSWLGLGETADEIVKNMKNMDENEMKERIKLALI